MGGMELPAGLAWSLVHIIPLSLIYFALRTLPTLLQWLILQYRARVVPEPEPSHWLLGHSKQIGDRKNLRTIRQKWIETNPRLYRTKITFLFQSVNLIHAETVVGVLRSSAPKHNYFYGFLKPWLGEGLLVSNGQKWARDRRLLTHCFHFDILRDYVEVYTDACGIMLQKWSESCARGESVDVTASCTMLTLDVILRCAMGFESDCQIEEKADRRSAQYVASVKALTVLIERRFLNLFHHNDFIYWLTSDGRATSRHLSILHDMSQMLIAERRAAINEDMPTSSDTDGHKHHKYRDFLDVLVTVKDEDGKGLTDEEIREQVDTFLFRGHDTTASALQWTIYYLSLHEDIQEKCRQEVQSVLQKSGHSTETMNHADLTEMIYLTQVLKESMRLSSPVPFISRELTEDMSVDGYTLPHGIRLTVPFFDVHCNPQLWPEPQKFDPDRFSLEQSKERSPFAFVPFSAGPRNCIGQSMAMDEMKATLAAVIARFRITPDADQPAPIWRSQLVARAEPNIKVCLQDINADAREDRMPE
eukprot:scpid32573/ scgid2886/ Leukotriene-B(4) omega-hydroxylase 1; CYPIVF2; Cytochrome P450 4F2; Cytochrome P450-LTB-omega; Leukotriene-B(4) 20-monooxygenase 1